MTLQAGTTAPAFSLQDQDGATHRLADYKGRPVVLYFYPKDDTSGCTKEACAFRDLMPAFQDRGAAVLGVSIQGQASKAKFAAKHALGFPLLADDRVDADGKPDPKVAAQYGVWVEKSMYGRTYMGVERATYLIAFDGTIARVWPKVKVPGHADEVAAALAEL